MDSEQYYFSKVMRSLRLHMRFRILLPLASVVLGAVLFRVGDLQVRKAIAVHGSYEGVLDGAARARYLDYALNAPAWAALGDTRDRRWSASTYWTGYDLRYFLAVIVMWFLIGLVLDRRSREKRGLKNPKKTKGNGILAWACLLYGLFTCYSIFPGRPFSIPLKSYFLWLGSALMGLWWWYTLGLAWGLALIAVALYSMFRIKKATV
jgi:hypothetical protein